MAGVGSSYENQAIIPDQIHSITGYHPGFAGGMEALLWEYRDRMIVDLEKWLSTDGLRMDMLILKKDPGLKIDYEIARIFRGHNIIEYKRPDDELTIDVFSKVLAYAYLYKSQSKKPDGIPFSDISATIYRHRYPRTLFKSLKENGMDVEKVYGGIYYIKGPLLFPVQVVVGKELSPERYSMLRVLTPDASREDIRNFYKVACFTNDPIYQKFVDDIYQVSISANRELYTTMMEEDPTMCEALRELFKEDFLQAEAIGEAHGEVKGRQKGIEESRLESIRNVMNGLKYTAEQAMDLLKIPVEDRSGYLSKL